VRPDPLPPTHRRPRTVDTSTHFCPHTDSVYRGWLGLGNLRANGHPNGGHGTSFTASVATAIFRSIRGPSFMTNGSRWNGSSACWHVWLKAWAFVRPLGCARSTPTRCGTVW